MGFDENYYYALAAAILITATLAGAAIRWFHMCRPYDRNAQYYFPGRPFIVIGFLSTLVLLPYVFHPRDADAWYVTRFFFLGIIPLLLTVLLFSYFGNIMEWRKWRSPMHVIGSPVALILFAALALAIWPGEQIGLINLALTGCLLYIPGAVGTAVCLASVIVVLAWARSFNEDDYSNPNDFPVAIAKRWTLRAFINLLLCWTTVLLNDRRVMAAAMLLFAFFAVATIISALNPHRDGPIEEEDPSEADEALPKSGVSKKVNSEILSSIRIVVEEQEAYLEAHLTIQDVADRCGYSRSYVASVIKAKYGGFFDYINGLRMKSMAAYQNQHPEATVQEAAEASGFASRQAYYMVKARLEKQD
jgi:AraC-like DNA-binding protein